MIIHMARSMVPDLHATKAGVIDDLRASFGELKCIGSERLVRQGISMSQLHVLNLLDRHGEMAMSRLADMLDVSMSAASGLVDRIEEARGRRHRDVQHVREATHRHLSMPVQQVEDMQLRHADALPDETFAADAFEFAERCPKVVDDAPLRGMQIRDHASCHVNYHTPVNKSVQPRMSPSDGGPGCASRS